MNTKVAVQVQFDKYCDIMLKTAAENGFKYISIGFGSYEGFVDEDWSRRIDSLKKLPPEQPRLFPPAEPAADGIGQAVHPGDAAPPVPAPAACQNHDRK